MPMCSMIGCGHRSGRDKQFSLFRIPAVIKHKGRDVQEKSEKRRTLWLAAISREFKSEQCLDNLRVCSVHFIKGQ